MKGLIKMNKKNIALILCLVFVLGFIPTTPASAAGTYWNFDSDVVTGDMTLEAEWEPNPYDCTFDSQGGTAVEKITAPYGTTFAEPTAPTRDYYTFSGWWTAAVGGAQWNFSTDTMPGNGTTLYAHWAIHHFDVTYNTNGGGSIPTEDVDYGATVTEPADPVRDHYNFMGWYTDNGTFVNAYNFSTPMGDAPLTLYAKWDGQPHVVSFDSNGGSTVEDENVKYGDTYTPTATPTKLHQDFDGWYKEATCENAWSGTIAGDMTLYAKWLNHPYDVTFQSNCDTVVGGQSVRYGSLVPVPTIITKEFYTFDAWYTTPTFDADSKWDFATDTMGESMTLYANWLPVKYDITFDSQGGSPVGNFNGDYATLIPEPEEPTREFYTFGGWYKEAGCATAWNFGTDTMPGNGATLYAKWVPNKYDVTFDSNGGSTIHTFNGDYLTLVTSPEDPTKQYYDFAGWYKDNGTFADAWNFTVDTIPGNGTTLYAKWTPKTYGVTFDSNGGSLVSGFTGDYGALVTEPTMPIKDFCTFSGWYKESGLLTPWDFATDTMPGEGTTLYAKWTPIKYDMVFNSQGGSAVETFNGDYGALVTRPADPTKEFYTLSGWYKESTYEHAWDFAIDTMPGNGATLYAKWVPTNYDVIFDSRGGSGVAPFNGPYLGLVTEPSVPARDFYDFAGWYADESCTVAWNFASDTVPGNGTTLYAKWNIHHNNVTYNSNGGSLVATEDVNYGEQVTEPATPTKEHYVFKGWYTDDATFSNQYNFRAPMGDAPLTLYAKWEGETLTIDFDTKGGVEVSQETAKYGETYTPAAVTTRDRYDFMGWFTEEGCVTEWSGVITNNMTLYAKWKLHVYTAGDIVYVIDPAGTAVITGVVAPCPTTITVPDTIPDCDTIILGPGAISAQPSVTKVIIGNGVSIIQPGAIDGCSNLVEVIIGTGVTDVPAGIVTDCPALATVVVPETVVTFDPTAFPAGTDVQYNVYYVVDGAPYHTTTAGVGCHLTFPTAPTKEHYDFMGWFTEPECSNEWLEATHFVSETVRLYAKWELHKHTVTYNTNGGTTVEAQYVGWNTKTVAPITTLVNYEFVNWYTEDTLENVWDFENTNVTADMTLYAKWQGIPCTVSFDTAGADTAIDNQTVRYNELVTAPTTVTKSHCDFAGWYKDPSCTMLWVFAVDTVLGNTTLYAKWNTAIYPVNFDSDGGTACDNQLIMYNNPVTPVTPTKEHYTFAGWYNGETEWDFAIDTVQGPMELCAHWIPEKYTVTFTGADIEAKQVDYDTYCEAPTIPTKDHYDFVYWYLAETPDTAFNFTETKITGNVGLTAKWVIKNYTTTYASNGGSAVDTTSTEYNTLVTEPEEPNREHYVFSGWYKEVTLENAWDFATDLIAGDQTLYAKWVGEPCTITFDSNEGSAVANQTVPYGGIVSTPTTPTRLHYTFKNWYVDAALTTLYDFSTPVAGATTLYAKWEGDPQTVTFNTRGGSSVGSVEVEYGKPLTLPTPPTQTHYDFVCWCTSNDCSVNYVTATPVTGPIILYAKWADHTYTVTFNVVGGTSVASQNLKNGEKVTEPTAPTKSSYTFQGWYKEAGYINKWAFGTDTISGNTTLYAKWQHNGGGYYTPHTPTPTPTPTPEPEKTLTKTPATGNVPASQEAKVVVASYVDKSGNTVIIPNGYYDTATGTYKYDATHVPSDAKVSLCAKLDTLVPVSESHWAFNNYCYLCARNTASEEMCKVDLNTKRGELVKMLALASGESLSGLPSSCGYSDVPDGSPYAAYLAWSNANGVTNGYPDGTFNPNGQATREEVAALVARYLTLVFSYHPEVSIPQSTYVDEGEIGGWAQKDVDLLSNLGIFIGIDEEEGRAFHPKSTIVNAETATVVYRILSDFCTKMSNVKTAK